MHVGYFHTIIVPDDWESEQCKAFAQGEQMEENVYSIGCMTSHLDAKKVPHKSFSAQRFMSTSMPARYIQNRTAAGIKFASNRQVTN